VYLQYAKSDLCGFLFTDDAYLALFQLMERAYKVSGFQCKNPELPVLFVSGAEDPCMGNVRAFAKSVRAMRYAGYRKVRGKLYPGMRHEILNEKEHQKVFNDLALYMKKNLYPTGKRV
jgi:alpha-beta hydrolase superfamily lysophospholipase